MDPDFFKYYNNIEPKKGDLLISEPYLPDKNFNRSVVLLCEHNDLGSFGFVLNRPSELFVKDLLEGFEQLPNSVFVGGPVQQDTVHFIHRNPFDLENSQEVSDGLFWGGNYDQLKVLAETGQLSKSNFKFFVGYSGWDVGQLKNELKENSWIICRNVSAKHIFDTEPDKLWKIALENMGGKYRMISNYPEDPRLN